MSPNTISLDKRFTLLEAERRFKKACDQIIMLNQRVSDIKKSYKDAKMNKNRHFQARLRRKLAMIEDTRVMFHDYARMKAEKIADLRAEIFG